MSKNKIDRTGEININNFGSEIMIIEYRKYSDIDVYFPEYNWTAKGVQYRNFKNGNIKCPYERRIYGVGYLGEGKYKAYDKNGKPTKCYTTWKSMLRRCYDPKFHEKEPTYKGCEVVKDLLNFQNFGYWYENNYYEIENEKMCLDKDILNKGNKIYSPENCVFVPQRINVLFTKSDKARGEYPIGVYYHNRNKKFVAKCSVYNYKTNKKEYNFLGYYETPEQAFEAYKQFKENYIKEVADYYKYQIPSKLYDAMYNYEIEIND